MKLKSHFLIFTILFVINLFFVGIVVFDDSSSSRGSGYSFKRIVPDKVKFKYTDNKDEALVIKTNKASGTTKLEINMNNSDGVPVKIDLKAKVDPNNPAKLKYKYRDEDDDKSTFVAIKYPGVKKAQANGSDTANVATNEQVNNQDKDSFKIFLERNGAEALVCKVKFGDGKLKIGSDEEIATPTYEIKNTLERKKKGNVEKLKVYHRNKYIASVSRSKESGKYKVKLVKEGQEEKDDLYSTKDLNYMSYAVGIMGIESMDPKLRAVIAAEILKKEK